ncbi:hypothetical protein NDU88_002094 [Pleurodeles waltl]|uniref:Uncharacterized protein n=1 Tax=Pleurodeles waltl TaxID=8319 RepID=A0AAV7UXR3_PLEWA|nr:hypothetical protein NDU88_002094 [Pleurodeles waltl]
MATEQIGDEEADVYFLPVTLLLCAGGALRGCWVAGGAVDGAAVFLFGRAASPVLFLDAAWGRCVSCVLRCWETAYAAWGFSAFWQPLTAWGVLGSAWRLLPALCVEIPPVWTAV